MFILNGLKTSFTLLKFVEKFHSHLPFMYTAYITHGFSQQSKQHLSILFLGQDNGVGVKLKPIFHAHCSHYFNFVLYIICLRTRRTYKSQVAVT